MLTCGLPSSMAPGLLHGWELIQAFGGRTCECLSVSEALGQEAGDAWSSRQEDQWDWLQGQPVLLYRVLGLV